MIQGTGSDVGKSLLVAGLCRLFADRGMAVRPFKPQNMSNNAAVTADGGEIGRAQALQARAARVPLSVHMNPVLLKPETEIGAQVVVQGKVVGHATAAEYHRMKPELLPTVLDSLRILSSGADLILVEGAGSAAEINLRAHDIANMGFAQAADIPVLLVGDIDRGGVIAQIVGTCAVLDEADRARLAGYVINKFRGDPALFAPGLEAIGARTGLTCFGVVPFWPLADRLPAEDSASLRTMPSGGGPIRIAVPMLPRISNFDDFDPLKAEPDVSLSFVPAGQPLPSDADLIVLPGSKATLADLAFLRAQVWDLDILAHVRRGGRVLGLCAGYQMLGGLIADQDGIESPKGSRASGLGLLDVATAMTGAKVLREVAGAAYDGSPVRGYEMHMGRTGGPDCTRPMLTLDGRSDGARSMDGRVMGCHLHGLFTSDAFRAALLATLRPGREKGADWEPSVEAALDDLAAHLARHLDIDGLLRVTGPAAS